MRKLAGDNKPVRGSNTEW